MAARLAFQYRCGSLWLLAAAVSILLSGECTAVGRLQHGDRNFRRIALQTTPTYPPPVILQSTAPHTATVFLFHGLGGSPADLDFLGPTLAAKLPHVKWVAPQAPTRYTTVSMSSQPAWYDIKVLGSLELASNEDVAGIDEVFRHVQDLIAAEGVDGIPASRIILGGFSQGAAVSLLTLRSASKLAGVFSLAGYLPLANATDLVSPENVGTPVLWCAGGEDATVPLELAQIGESALQEAGANLTFQIFEDQTHGYNAAELTEVEGSLIELLPPAPSPAQFVAG